MSSTYQRSFAGGELSPSLAARGDQNKYQAGLSTCRNMIVRKSGGVWNRPGTKFCAEVENSAYGSWLAKFIFNDGDSALIELGKHSYLGGQVARVLINGALVQMPAAAPWNPVGVYTQGDAVTYAGATWYAYNMDWPPIVGEAPNVNSFRWTGSVNSNLAFYTSLSTHEFYQYQYAQSADVMTFAVGLFPPWEIRRYANDDWRIIYASTNPQIAAPSAGLINSGAPGAAVSWVVTSVSATSGRESLASVATTSNTVPTVGTPVTVSWTTVAGASNYFVYRKKNGANCFIGVSGEDGSPSFIDDGIIPDESDNPPTAFDWGNVFPNSVCYSNQRIIYANGVVNTYIAGNGQASPQKVWCSAVGDFYDFAPHTPVQDDDPVEFTIDSSRPSPILSIIDLDRLILFGANGEYTVSGNGDGVITPTDINAKQRGHIGSAQLRPIVINQTPLMVSARGGEVRSFAFDFAGEGYKSIDLTVYADHLFKGHTIVAWDYQRLPDSVVWAVRDDGVLLGLTYIPEQDIWGWHRHDTDGFFEDVICIPEAEEDAVYFIVRRTIGGATKRYIERLKSRTFTDYVTNGWFVDSGVSYDGDNNAATTLTLSGGSTWAAGESLTLTASAATFSAGDVGVNEYRVGYVTTTTGSDGLTTSVTTYVWLTVTAYTSTTIVTVTPNKPVPASIRAVATTLWSKALLTITGLSHLEGKTVACIADGFAVTGKVVTAGVVLLDHPAAYVRAGLGYVSDAESLPLDPPQASISDKQKILNGVTIRVQDTVGGTFGTDDDDLHPWKQRRNEVPGSPATPYTGHIPVALSGIWANDPTVFIRQALPLPITVLGILPQFAVGGKS